MKKSFAPVMLPLLLTVGLASQASAGVEPRVGPGERAAAHSFHMLHTHASDIKAARTGVHDIGAAHERYAHLVEAHAGVEGHAGEPEGAAGVEGHHIHNIIERIKQFIANHHPHPVPDSGGDYGHGVNQGNMHQAHDNALDLYDFDQTGSIGWCEFGYMASDTPAQVEHVRRVLQLAEANGGGSIDDAACKTALTEDPVVGPYIEHLFASADDDSDGKIEVGESTAAIDIVMNGYDLNCDGVIDGRDVESASHVTMSQVAANRCSPEA